jgi:hypothetical protein
MAEENKRRATDEVRVLKYIAGIETLEVCVDTLS